MAAFISQPPVSAPRRKIRLKICSQASTMCRWLRFWRRSTTGAACSALLSTGSKPAPNSPHPAPCPWLASWRGPVASACAGWPAFRHGSESELEHAVNWRFSLENIRTANDIVIKATDGKKLPDLYRRDPGELHTAGDGQTAAKTSWPASFPVGLHMPLCRGTQSWNMPQPSRMQCRARLADCVWVQTVCTGLTLRSGVTCTTVSALPGLPTCLGLPNSSDSAPTPDVGAGAVTSRPLPSTNSTSCHRTQ